MNIYCGNCGKYGHIYKKCNQPIMSLGIICFKIIDEKIHYLLIKRKCSLNYVNSYLSVKAHSHQCGFCR